MQIVEVKHLNPSLNILFLSIIRCESPFDPPVTIFTLPVAEAIFFTQQAAAKPCTKLHINYTHGDAGFSKFASKGV